LYGTQICVPFVSPYLSCTVISKAVLLACIDKVFICRDA
jgi:hypothetical protein